MLTTVQSGNRQFGQMTGISRTEAISHSKQPLRTENRVARLQWAHGNQGMLKLMTGSVLERQLSINRPRDRFEQEADTVAAAVMRTPDPTVPTGSVSPKSPAAGAQCCSCGQSRCGATGECEECKAKTISLQRVSAGSSQGATAPSIVHEVLRSPGQPLEASTRSFMQPRFGHDFSNVRIHADLQAAESAAAMNAVAYAVGKDVVFGQGQYRPGTQAGRKLLAHELVHTVQQQFAGAAGVQCYKVEDCDPKDNPLEQPSTVHDAHKRALEMLNNANAKSANSTDPAVQSAAQTHFNITLPAPDSFTQYLWATAKRALGTMKAADANAVYECEPKQNWWNGGCIKGNVAVSLFNIHLCPLWWQAFPALDCRASILVHEWAHKWGKGVNRVFESYQWEPKFQKMAAKDRIKMPDAYAGYAYELYTGNPWTC
jgi:Domain of unknown function (DUF4157)